MTKRSKIKFEPKCESCGHLQEPDEKQSDKNLKVYLTVCSKCGGRVKASFSNIN